MKSIKIPEQHLDENHRELLGKFITLKNDIYRQTYLKALQQKKENSETQKAHRDKKQDYGQLLPQQRERPLGLKIFGD